jgi:uncharacterized protein (DUF952 family)
MIHHLYHITTKVEWEAAHKKGVYINPSFDSKGYIPCCGRFQTNEVIERYFKGQTGLVSLMIITQKLKSPVVYESIPDGVEYSPDYPPVYARICGPINTDAVYTVSPFYAYQPFGFFDTKQQ